MQQWREVFIGVGLAMRRSRFWVAWGVTVVTFGTLMNLLAGGMAAFNLMGAMGFPSSLKVIGDACLGIVGVGRNFWDWLPMFGLTMLQGVLIGLLVVVWHERKINPPACQIKRQQKTPAMQTTDTKDANKKPRDHLGDQLHNTGIVAGLAILGSGCPTCGTTLLAPVVASLFGSTSLALAGTVAGILNIGAAVLAFWTLWKLGAECYVIMKRAAKEE